MIFIQLTWVFLKIGILGFGGGYAMLSLIQNEVVRNHQWDTTHKFFLHSTIPTKPFLLHI